MRIVIACGGTGGHIFPAIGLAEVLREQNAQIDFIGTKRDIEGEIRKRGYNLETLPIATVSFRSVSASFVSTLNLLKSFFKSFGILRKIRPDVAVGFGGYVSGPVLLAAFIMRIPTIIHEQNVVAGKANRILSRFVNRVAISFKETEEYLKSKKIVLTGCPVRSDIFDTQEHDTKKLFDFDKDKFTILVMGGSLGAHKINQVFLQTISLLEAPDELQIIHISGKQDYETVRREYEKKGIDAKIFAFCDKMGYAYRVADLVISRAGAATITELASLGMASILIPYPSRYVHQKENALSLAARGAAVLIEEDDFNAEALKREIVNFLEERQKLVMVGHNAKTLGMQKAADNLAREVLSAGK